MPDSLFGVISSHSANSYPPFCGSPHNHCRGCECVAPSLQTGTRHCDSLGPSFCGLVDIIMQFGVCNPREQATHVGGGGLDCVFISRSCAVLVRVHSGDHCCPLLGSDHFLCVAQSIPLLWVPQGGPNVGLFLLSGIGHQPSSVHTVLCSTGVLDWTLSCVVLSPFSSSMHILNVSSLTAGSQFGGRRNVSQRVCQIGKTHPKTLSSKNTFVQEHFHPKTLSSKTISSKKEDNFIQ